MKRYLIIAIVLGCVGFGNLIYHFLDTQEPPGKSIPILSPVAEEPNLESNLVCQASLNYWIKAKPIVERQIAEVGQPLASLILEIGSDIWAGNASANNEFVKALQEAQPHLGQAFLELSELKPPPGLAMEWHQAQLKAWGMRLDAINILVGGWDFDHQTFVGSEEDAQLGGRLWDESMLAGQDADRAQNELLKWLAECSGIALP